MVIQHRVVNKSRSFSLFRRSHWQGRLPVPADAQTADTGERVQYWRAELSISKSILSNTVAGTEWKGVKRKKKSTKLIESNWG